MRKRGFTLLELMIVTMVFGILATVLLNRLAYYEEAAEKAEVEFTISSIKSTLRFRISTLMIEGRLQESANLAGQNPIAWLGTKPDNYLGELAAPALEDVPPGNWYFDTVDRALVYQVRKGAYFQPDSVGRKRIRIRISPVHNWPEPSGGSGEVKPTDTVMVQLLEAYKWL